ncbi:hypothetical protein NC652_016559 [Populus alba x Populus x berolinensis]|nr:hypothetical protein NC652_016559 [Populus alba x Populus x berolinensis]
MKPNKSIHEIHNRFIIFVSELVSLEKIRELEIEDKKQNKSLAFKFVTNHEEINEYDNEEEDDDIAIIVKEFTKFLRKKKRENVDKRESSNRDTIICYECKKPNYIKYDCPNFKNKAKLDKKKGKEKGNKGNYLG